MSINIIAVFPSLQYNFFCYLFLTFSMERKNTEKMAVVRSQIQKGKKKKTKASASQSRNTTSLRKGDTKHLLASPCLSDEIDEDYAEFLKTYDPQEVYPYTVSSGGEAESVLIVNTQEGVVQTVQAEDEKR
jgi:hypothetical protein